MPDVITEATLSLSAMEEDDDLVYGNSDPMLSSPTALPGDNLLTSPHRSTADPLLCEQRLPTPTPTSHIDKLDGDTLDMDMIA